jgi:hypothetical protein
MKKLVHRYRVQATDDARVSEFTRWKQYGGRCAERKDAWALAQQALGPGGFRHVRVVEERVYKGRD